MNRFFQLRADYLRDLEQFKTYSAALAASESKTGISKIGEGELYVVVIGESASRDKMHAYGGVSKNTPWMDGMASDPGWVLFTKAYSTHTHTVPALSAALTAGNVYTGLTFPRSHTIMSLGRAAGMQTIWISNQVKRGIYDNAVSAIASGADTTVFSGDEAPPDGVLLPLIKQVLEKRDKTRNTLLVVHLMGSHVSYNDRYPQEFPELKEKGVAAIGEAAQDPENAEDLSEYETAVAYTDSVLKEIFSLLRKEGEHPAAFIYFSDHGEDPVDRRGHNSEQFTWTMARIPLAVWASPSWRVRYPERFNALRGNTDQIFTNDLLFNLYAGLAGIRFPEQNDALNLSSPTYNLPLDLARIQPGGRFVREDLQTGGRENLRRLSTPGHAVGMHRVNTLYKAREAAAMGADYMETDVIFTGAPGAERLLTGHEAASSTGLDLKELLASDAVRPMRHIWLDLKDLKPDTAGRIFTALSELDSEFSLKKRCLIESRSPEALKIFADAGWDTSFYLPWESVKAVWESDDAAKKNTVAQQIADAVRRNGVRGISYDLRADEAVCGLLLPLMDKNVRRHSWNTKWKANDEKLAEKLAPYSGLTTILVTMPSAFSY